MFFSKTLKSFSHSHFSANLQPGIFDQLSLPISHSPSSITFKEEREEPKLFPLHLSYPGPPEISHTAKELFLTDG